MRNSPSRIRTVLDFRLILRLTSFLCILTGVLSLLVIALPESFSPVIASALVRSPEESLGLIYMGFALRLSRLERYSKAVRIVLWAARFGLLAAGALGVQGIAVFGRSAPAGANPSASGLAVSLCFILMSGALLASSGRFKWSRRVAVLLSLLGALIASCWISIFLAAAGLVARPPLLEISLLPLVLVSLVTFCLALSNATPGLLEVFRTDNPASDAARQTFPLAICLPVVLAILRHWAEKTGYLHPSVGLLAHVLISVAATAAIVGWNIYLLGLGNRVRESIESSTRESESEHRALLESLSEPVWIFDVKGEITFSNAPAALFSGGKSPDGNGLSMPDLLGKSQYHAIVSSVVFMQQLREITLYDWQSGEEQIRQICFLDQLKARGLQAASFILVLSPTCVIEDQKSAGLIGLSNALKSQVPSPVQGQSGPGPSP